MKARGLLMIEHRLIEKMLVLAKKNIETMNPDTYNPILVDNIVDFIRVYADRTHHGKEEDILFRDLEKKKLESADAAMMNELIGEHRQARVKVQEIVLLNGQFKDGDRTVVPRIREIVFWLSEFYPVHIKKEDAVFFPNADGYFSESELDAQLKEYYSFDAKMIHEKYQNLYAELNREK